MNKTAKIGGNNGRRQSYSRQSNLFQGTFYDFKISQNSAQKNKTSVSNISSKGVKIEAKSKMDKFMDNIQTVSTKTLTSDQIFCASSG